ncbi:TonB family protein [Bradyrhizobium sp. 1(2017)]|uniref:TonB family protein n=1 Tax=Bradyrhizobium sp. 1(2017) TaxID=1404888 RepID=UPI00140F2E3F|nr:TonB family protein [Bradyrhizobium sp. 1(2017)]QIO36670.1 TonB family protein [Bradyrhizobium sp. 1(2017)]
MIGVIMRVRSSRRRRRGRAAAIPGAVSLPALLLVSAAAAEEGTYRERLSSHIARFPYYPDAVADLTISGTTYVRFRVSRDGRLLGSDVKQSSGDDDLDRAALDAVERSQPFPAVPPEIPDAKLEFIVPFVFKDRTGLVTSVTGDLHLAARMTGMCGSTAGGMEFSCRFAAYYLSKAGTSYFRMPLAGFRFGRELWFAGSAVAITGMSYQLTVDRVILRGLAGQDENPEPSIKPAIGSCAQIGNFTRRKVSTISCEATDEAGNKYTANFATDGSAVKVMRDTDERQLVPAK